MATKTMTLYEQQQQYIEERIGREDYTHMDEVFADAERLFTPNNELKIQAIRESWQEDDADYEAGIYFTADELTPEIIGAEAKAWKARLRAQYGSAQARA